MENVVESRFNNKALLGLFILCVILVILNCWQCTKRVEDATQAQNFIGAIYDTLHQTRNQYGQQVSTIKVLYGTVDELKQIGNKKDSALVGLQKIVDKKTMTATIADVTTNSRGASKTQISYSDGDTNKDNEYQLIQKPTYRTSWDNKWDSGGIVATSDSIFRNIKIRNDFEFTQKFESKGLFNLNKIPIVTMVNKNPNTTTIELRTYTVQPAPANRGWIAAIALVLGFAADEFIRTIK